ncbi:MAG: hypothetical protein V9E99_11995 [Microthrixaceae bacterium]
MSSGLIPTRAGGVIFVHHDPYSVVVDAFTVAPSRSRDAVGRFNKSYSVTKF